MRRIATSLAVVAACAGAPLGSPVFDHAVLSVRTPAVPEATLARLAESPPYPHVTHDGVDWLLCRWRSDLPIPVSLPPDATLDEQAILRRALAAWEATGLGVRFALQPAGGAASIGMRFSEAGRFDEPGLSGATRADCRVGHASTAGVRPASPSAEDRGVIDAELVYARITLARRTPRDWRDRDRPLSPAELAGAALHEIGHALGFPGHASGGESVMVRTREDVIRIGARVLSGGALHEGALRALYGLPAGLVVARAPLTAARSEPFVRLAALADNSHWTGPFVRVGDLGARVFFVDRDAREIGIDIPSSSRHVRDAGRFVGLPDSSAREAFGPAQQ